MTTLVIITITLFLYTLGMSYIAGYTAQVAWSKAFGSTAAFVIVCGLFAYFSGFLIALSIIVGIIVVMAVLTNFIAPTLSLGLYKLITFAAERKAYYSQPKGQRTRWASRSDVPAALLLS